MYDSWTNVVYAKAFFEGPSRGWREARRLSMVITTPISATKSGQNGDVSGMKSTGGIEKAYPAVTETASLSVEYWSVVVASAPPCWWKRQDSNLRNPFGFYGFSVRRLQPLGHSTSP